MKANRTVLLLAMMAAAVLLLPKRILMLDDGQLYQGDADSGDDETILDSIGQTMDQVIGSVAPGPVADMWASEELRAMLKAREKLRLERYNIGDGGWTIGYGHFEKNIANIPARITLDEAEGMFNRDLGERAEKWVRLYVQVPLQQYEFDALVHVAYNMSPKSFKKFADSVNRGEGIGAIAEASIYWVRAGLQNGIRNRRNEELALFNLGHYA